MCLENLSDQFKQLSIESDSLCPLENVNEISNVQSQSDKMDAICSLEKVNGFSKKQIASFKIFVGDLNDHCHEIDIEMIFGYHFDVMAKVVRVGKGYAIVSIAGLSTYHEILLRNKSISFCGRLLRFEPYIPSSHKLKPLFQNKGKRLKHRKRMGDFKRH